MLNLVNENGWTGGHLTLELETSQLVTGIHSVSPAVCNVKTMLISLSLDNQNWVQAPCQKCSTSMSGCYNPDSNHLCAVENNEFDYAVLAKYVKFEFRGVDAKEPGCYAQGDPWLFWARWKSGLKSAETAPSR